MKGKFKFVGIGIVVILILIQFFNPKNPNSPASPELDFISIHQPSTEVRTLLKSACYDCHSEEVNWPWYANIAPISWKVVHDIDEGKEHLNFSRWGAYSPEKAEHKLEECAEELEEGEMPLNAYTWTHPEADLTDDKREMLVVWFENLRK